MEHELIVSKLPWGKSDAADAAKTAMLLEREWLVTNGLGGYASSTVSGACTRRYHGLLVAALPNPLGRVVMLSHVAEEARFPNGTMVQFGSEERAEGILEVYGSGYLSEFRLELGLPVWTYDFGGFVMEKRLLLPRLQNSVHVTYRLLSGPGAVRLRLRPSMQFRPHDAPVSLPLGNPYSIVAEGDRYEVRGEAPFPPLRMLLYARDAAMVLDRGSLRDTHYRREKPRGYEAQGVLWSPGYFRCNLAEGQAATLVASTEEWATAAALTPDDALKNEFERRRRLVAMAHPKAQDRTGAELVLATDQFIIVPQPRPADAQARAAGDEIRSIIAGYHWFTDWGRDTMISLEGLALDTGRHAEAGCILRTFSYYVKDGLIPNLFPEGEQEARYNTADASLWYFHAIDRYLNATGDRRTLQMLLPKLVDIVGHHILGTRFGIGVDPKDGLLVQGTESCPLTWMDAQVGNWVITPRRGKAVEINALWYNALRLIERWVAEEHGKDASRPYAEHAERAFDSFNRRFWYDAGGYLYDVIDGEQGDDASLRPNQILAVSLPNPVLDGSHREAVVEAVRRHLLTPVGLRSLAPGHPDYESRYYGDVRARDAAYHQGTVWAWLIGPFVDAWLAVHPEDFAGARKFLEGFLPHLSEGCMGQIAEVFDAEEPYAPRGCIAQAWSVAEVFRAWVKTAG